MQVSLCLRDYTCVSYHTGNKSHELCGAQFAQHNYQNRDALTIYGHINVSIEPYIKMVNPICTWSSLEQEIAIEQAYFRKGRGTRDGIANLR